MSDVRFRTKDPDHDGWLFKWTNYIKGYQRRWFVLKDGVLSYYRNPADVSHTCRGSIKIMNALIHTEESCNFLVSNGGTQTFHLRAASEIERQKWVTALELAKSRIADSEDEDDYAGRDLNSDKMELQQMLKNLVSKLDDLKTCHELNVKRATALQRSLTELDQISNPSKAQTKIKSINERITLLKITSSAMIKNSAEYLDLAQSHGKKWQKLLQHEHETRLKLEEMIEQLAKQHSHLEQRARKEAASINSPKSSNSDDEEFFDAEETAGGTADFFVSLPGRAHRVASIHTLPTPSLPSETAIEDEDESTGSDNSEYGGDSQTRDMGVVSRVKSSSSKLDKLSSSCTESIDKISPPSPTFEETNNCSSLVKRERRKYIPERPNHSLNLWSFMKNCIGKELTKIPMPVNFNEPLSMLQRLTEDFEYANLLHTAARIKDPCEQLTYIAAFSASNYATSAIRTGKPFNPLLGETYECDRTADLGWKSISEQVSHHPPMLAMHCQGKGWKLWNEFSISSKFRGKYLQVTPMDITHLEFERTGYHITWRKVTTTVHNIIVGRLWIDHHGDINIVNHTTGDQCHLKFLPYSYFSRDAPRKVTGVVVNSENEATWVLQGTWDTKVEASRVIDRNGSAKGKPILETSTPRVIWKQNALPEDSEKMYNLTQLAIELNEPEEGVAPTDSRNRPDQRLMEQGKWDEANRIKSLLEEKQRTVRKKREEEAEMAALAGRPVELYKPRWFEKQKDPITGNPVHVYTGQYWQAKQEQNWTDCPDIFNLDDVSLAQAEQNASANAF